MKRFITMIVASGMAACMGGPQVMQQSNQSKEKSSEVEAAVAEQVAGVMVGQFEARSDVQQVMNASDASAVQGAKIMIAPNSLAISTSISLEEGASIALDSIVQNASGNSGLGIAATTNAVMVTSSVPMDLAKPMTVQLVLPSGSSLLDSDMSNLTVIFKVRKESANAWVEGYIPRDQLSISQQKITFTTSHFGTYQAAFLTAPATQVVKEIVATTPAISKIAENAMPEVVWSGVKAVFSAPDRTVKVTGAATGHQALLFCEVVGDTDQAAPFDMRQEFKSLSTATFFIKSQKSESYSFRWTCEEQNGRRSQSAWSEKVEIPKVEFPYVNQAPTITITQPSNPHYVGASGAFSVAFNAVDPDDVATIKLFYKGSTGSCDATLTGWTEIVANLSEGMVSSYNWNLSALPAGTYHICAVISDKAASAYALAPGQIIKLSAPSVTLTAAQPNPTTAKTINLTAQFSHAVTGLSSSMLITTNGTVSNFTATSATTYTFDVTTSAGGMVNVTLPAGVIADVAGNPNSGASFGTLVQIPPVLANAAAASYVTGIAGPAIEFSNSGGAAASCVITPALPAGLSIAKFGTTCKISGTPTSSSIVTTYTVEATADDGSKGTATVEITVGAANPPVLANQTAKTLVATMEMPPIDFINSGASAVACAMSGPLSGVTASVVGNSCRLSGIPTALGANSVTVTATASDGSTGSTTISITVIAANKPDLANLGEEIFHVGVTKGVYFTNNGSAALNCQVSPSLPPGLTAYVSGLTCKIYGAPTALSNPTTYVVTATADDGSTDTASVMIRVVNPNPPVFGTIPTIHATAGAIIGDIPIGNTGGIVQAGTCTVTPDLPEGIFAENNGNSCKIFGTPVNAHAISRFTLQATTTDGSMGEKEFTLGVGTLAYMSTTDNQRAVVYDQSSGKYWSAYVKNSSDFVIASSPDGVTWHEKATINSSADSTQLSVAHANGRLFVATLEPNGVEVRRFDLLSAGPLAADQTVVAFSGSPSSLSNPAVAVGPENKLVVGAVQGQGALRKAVIIQSESDATSNNTMTFASPSTLGILSVHPDGFALVGTSNNLITVVKDLMGRLRTFRFNHVTNSWPEMPGTESSWSGPIFSGLPGTVRATTIFQGRLYAGGTILDANLTPQGGFLAYWNSASWQPVGNINGSVLALKVGPDNSLYVGGSFTMIDGVADRKHIARWNGISWEHIGSGVNGTVFTIEACHNKIYAGGLFSYAGATPYSTMANNIASWSGTAWSPLGGGVNNSVFALACNGAKLNVGGAFSTAGEFDAAKIATWDDEVWSPEYGMSFDGDVFTLLVKDGSVYAGGAFTIPQHYVAKWNGSSWVAVGGGLQGTVRTLHRIGNDIFAGGNFASRISKWNGNSWTAPAGTINSGLVWSLTSMGTELFIGGDFTQPGDPEVKNFTSYNIGHIQKSYSFSLAPTDTGAILASTSSTGGQFIHELTSVVSSPIANLGNEGNIATPIQISSTPSGDRKAVVWRKQSGQIVYKTYSHSVWSSEKLVDQSVHYSMPRTPATFDHYQVPVLWIDNANEYVLRSGVLGF